MTDESIMTERNRGIAEPAIRSITPDDLRDALRRGMEDFRAKPSHPIFLTLIYPVVCVLLLQAAAGRDLLPLLFPLLAGFALLGPLAAIGLYELSRRRELGQEMDWRHAFDVFRRASSGAIPALSIALMAIFFLWLYTAVEIYEAIFGSAIPPSLADFLIEVLTTHRGWLLILAGNAVGVVFAVAAMSISVVSFPLLLDRDVGMVTAVRTSVRAVLKNPRTMALWGGYVAGGLMLGFLPFALGLAVVLPLFGHATWHLYRKVVAW